MQAIIQPRYGSPDVLELTDLPVPQPKADEVLVRVRASSVNAADIETLGGMFLVRMASPLRPAHRIPGSDVAGVVEQVGSAVTSLAPGDEVFGDLSEFGYGAFAEFVSAKAAAFWPRPAGLTFEEAAAVPSAAWVAIKGIRDQVVLGAGSEVLVNGAGGGMGTYAVQMAVARGAAVTGVDRADKLELVRSLGAVRVIDYQAVDYTRQPERYDLIIDVFARRSVRDSRRALKPAGAYTVVGASTPRILQSFLLGALLTRTSDQRIGPLFGWPHSEQDVDDVNELIEAGAVRPVIDRVYPLAKAPDAMQRVADGDVAGKAVIST